MNDTHGKLSQLLKTSYKEASALTGDTLTKISNQIDRLSDERFCLGITGLSQSGKSTFITSLINQLLHHDTSNLPGFSPVLSERLIGVKVHPLEDGALPPFPYEEAYEKITRPKPQWPESTVNTSGCLLELKLKKSDGQINPFSRESYSLFLEIRDYPGEWLLDLPLRDMSYSRWSSQCNAQYTQQPRKEILGSLLEQLQQLDPLAEADNEVLKRLHSDYLAFLKKCKHSDKSLSLIQPGRFLIPGDIPDADVLFFIPLLKVASYTEDQLEAAAENSYFKLCEKRYKRYIKELIDPFYKKFFHRIDRQLVIVDVVNALNAGPAYVDDMRQAVSNITDSFAYARQNRVFQLFNPKIDKVVFVASKIDQVLSEDHESVRQLLGQLIRQAYKSAQHEGVFPECEAAAAVRSSREVKHEGERGITGADSKGEPIGYMHPTIPPRIPEGDEWQAFVDWKIPTLSPPRGLSSTNNDSIPHIRMDTVLNILIGDKCQ